jgi:hypothetical protein
MEAIRAISATIVAVCIFNGTISLSAHTVKSTKGEGILHETERAEAIPRLGESVVANDRFATHVEELKT